MIFEFVCVEYCLGKRMLQKNKMFAIMGVVHSLVGAGGALVRAWPGYLLAGAKRRLINAGRGSIRF
jgi:hypothetical protein